VRSFVLHESSLLWTPALRTYSGSVCLPRDRKGIGRCAMCVSDVQRRQVIDHVPTIGPAAPMGGLQT